MIANIFQGLFRSVLRNKLLTAINLSGLALGFSSCILIILFLFDQLGYDRHHVNLDRIYRVSTKFISEGSVDNVAISASPLPEAFLQNFPEVEESVRINSKGAGVTIRTSSSVFHEENLYSADPGIFRMFSYNFIQGNPSNALSQPKGLVLTRSEAKKYFGTEDAQGKILQVDGNDHQVTGVIEDVPRNSDIYFGMLVPLDTANQKDWFDFSHYVFLMFNRESIRNPSLITSFQQKLDKLVDDRINAAFRKESQTMSASMTIQPLKGLHFDTSFAYDTPKGNKDYVYIFVSVAILILFIACINYINFSIVQSMERSREVGIRKVIGSTFVQLVSRYLSHSLIWTFVALLLAIMLVYLLLPQFNNIVDRNFTLTDLARVEIVVSIFGIVTVTGVLAGSYPAFYSSSLKTVNSLKGELSAPAGKFIRKISITLQFAVTLGLLIATVIIYSQMKFVQNYNLGFKKDNVIAISTPEDSVHYQSVLAFKNELLSRVHLVKSVSIAGDGGVPGDPNDEQRGSQTLKNESGKEVIRMVNNSFIDANYVDVLNVEMKLGRNYTDGTPYDRENSIIVNEALVRALGWKDPLSKTIRWREKERAVIGVMGNIHYKSLYNPVQPQLFVPHEKRIVNVIARLNDTGSETLAQLQTIWTTHFPNEPFRYRYLDDTLNSQYKQEETATAILSYFSVLTIVISICGMFGLSLLSAVQRKREIGIRKAIGAEFKDIALLFSKEYMMFILIAMLAVCPLVWYFIRDWLQSFVSHVPLRLSIFILVGLLFGMIALASVLLSIGRIARKKSVELMN